MDDANNTIATQEAEMETQQDIIDDPNSTEEEKTDAIEDHDVAHQLYQAAVDAHAAAYAARNIAEAA